MYGDANAILWINFPSIKTKYVGEKIYLFNALSIYFGVGDGARGVWSQVEATRVEVIWDGLKAELVGVCVDLVIYKASFHRSLQAGLYMK